MGRQKKRVGFSAILDILRPPSPGGLHKGLLAHLLYWFFQYIGVGVGAGLHPQEACRWAISSVVERAPDNRVVVPGL